MLEDELARKQELQIGLYADARVKRFMQMLEYARLELQATIAEADELTAQRVNSINAQIDNIQRQLSSRIRSEMPTSQDLALTTKGNLEDLLKVIVPDARVAIDISIGALNTETIYRFSVAELEHVSSVTAEQLSAVRSALYSNIGIQGQNPTQVARKLAGRGGVFEKAFPHVETILRTETSSVYNAQSLSGVKYVNENYGLALRKRIVETIDVKRNHPISEVLNNQVREADDLFKASVSEVAAKARQLKKGVSGIFWPVKNGFYVGQRLPAHFRERGIVVPTKKELTQ